MSITASLKIVDNKDRYTQKCLIPFYLLKRSALKPGDLVSITCDTFSVICRIFPLPSTSLETSILIDDTVRYETHTFKNKVVEHKRLTFPEDFTVLKATILETVEIKLVLHNLPQACYSKNKRHYRNIVFKLLQNFSVGKNAVVECSGLELADMFCIHSIIVTETYQEEDMCGRLARNARIEIKEVLLKEQLSLLREIKIAQLGGIDQTIALLNFYLFQRLCKRIVVVGPSGSGKSTLVKKYCSDLDCSLIIIDGMKSSDLSLQKCDSFYDFLIHSSFERSPNHCSILFIDHIDKLAPSELKQGTFSNYFSMLVKLVKSLMHSNVLIIATAMQRKFIHPALSSFFQEELFLGIPSVQQRKEILQLSLKSANQIDLDKIANMMPGFMACDIVHLAEEVLKRKVKGNMLSVNDTQLTTQDFEEALISMTPSILKTSEWSLKIKPIYWKDIGGMVKIKERLQMCIEKPLLHPEVFEKVDLHCPTGVLLFGPPGCCKTTLARGLATECNANFFAANPSQIYSAYVGESEKNISQLFYQARLCSPSIIFLDELDSLVGYRDLNTKQQGVAEKVLSTLLNEMDGSGIKTNSGVNINSEGILPCSKEDKSDAFEKKNAKEKVIVVAATNRPDCIDNALLRSGRFDVILYVPPPNYEERESILHTITAGMPLHEVDFTEIAEKTEFLTGADLKNLCNMAAMNALRQDMINAEYVTQDDFRQALKNLQPSITREQIQMYEKLSTKYGPLICD